MITFDCKHQYCNECTPRAFRELIKNSEIDKLVCFEPKCKKPVSDEKIMEIF